MDWSLDISPLATWPLLGIAAAVLAVLAATGLALRSRGAPLRALAAVAVLLALINPVLMREDREPVKTVVAVVTDRSQSQRIGERTSQADEALGELADRIARNPAFDVRYVESGAGEATSASATNLFETLAGALRDVPPSRIGGAIMLTDGQVHDAPDDADALGFDAPLHVLVTGNSDEFDRKIEFVRAPRFSLTNQPMDLAYRVSHSGAGEPPAEATVRIYLNGDLVETQAAAFGVETAAQLSLPRAGVNIIELAIDTEDGEITGMNNRAIVQVEGIRENLRVLLVSGEPHSGERTWRNLLKSDASVDLVHFTILRPPEKQDGTPINELSLIAFPTRELFVERIEDFDLIIFDRYQHRDVLPILYYDYIAEYVRKGGALLVAAGPEYAGEVSIARTPLVAALPALPTGGVVQEGYFPRLTDSGRKHPVTRDLPGGAQEPPAWGRWFRTISVEDPQGDIVMQGAGEAPLMVLNRYGEGRVGLLLSDQGWLWARGFEGGGPHVGLYRRVAHWLMKEPELEEEALTARAVGQSLSIVRQTMGDPPGPARVITPSGETVDVPLTEDQPGRFTGTLETDEIGLFQLGNGDLAALAHVGPVDAPEFKDMISTTAVLQPVADDASGSVRRLDRNGEVTVPSIVPVRSRAETSGRDWIGLRTTDETVLRGVDRFPLYSGFLGLALLLAALGSTWWREGR